MKLITRTKNNEQKVFDDITESSRELPVNSVPILHIETMLQE